MAKNNHVILDGYLTEAPRIIRHVNKNGNVGVMATFTVCTSERRQNAQGVWEDVNKQYHRCCSFFITVINMLRKADKATHVRVEGSISYSSEQIGVNEYRNFTNIQVESCQLLLKTSDILNLPDLAMIEDPTGGNFSDVRGWQPAVEGGESLFKHKGQNVNTNGGFTSPQGHGFTQAQDNNQPSNTQVGGFSGGFSQPHSFNTNTTPSTGGFASTNTANNSPYSNGSFNGFTQAPPQEFQQKGFATFTGQPFNDGWASQSTEEQNVHAFMKKVGEALNLQETPSTPTSSDDENLDKIRQFQREEEKRQAQQQ